MIISCIVGAEDSFLFQGHIKTCYFDLTWLDKKMMTIIACTTSHNVSNQSASLH